MAGSPRQGRDSRWALGHPGALLAQYPCLIYIVLSDRHPAFTLSFLGGHMRRSARRTSKRFNRRQAKTHRLNKSAPLRGGIRL